MPYGNINVDTVTTSTTGGILGAGNASIMKNRIINGAMVIDQRNAGASVTPTSANYTLDRWYADLTQASKYSVQQNAGSVTPPVGFTNYLGATSLAATSVGASDYFYLWQGVEGFNIADLGWGTANAKTVTLSFWVRSSLTGTFGGSLKNSANNRSYPYTYTISVANTWEQKSITIVGDTSGTWLTTNGLGVGVHFGLGVGSTYSGTAGAWAGANYQSATGATSVVGTNGATFYITGVQLEVGSSATGFEYVNYQTSLANCQRYFQKVSFLGGIASGGGSANMTSTYGVTMRAGPTVSLSGALSITDGSADFTQSSANISTYVSVPTGFYGAFSNFTGLTTSRPAFATQPTATLLASAEL